MNRKRYSSLLFGLLALSLILFGIPLKASAYHSGSESDLTANPELVAFRNYGGSSVDKLALNPELATIRSYRVSGSPVLKVDSGRWSAIGFYYGQYMAMLRGAEADSARWAAMGDNYVGIIAGIADDDVIGALHAAEARLATVGGYYTGLTPARATALVRQAALVDPGLTPARAAALIAQAALADLRPLPPDSIRRSALGFYYAQKMARLRSAEADSARWVSMGTLYGPEIVRAGQPDFNPYQSALGLYYAARGRDADSARWVAMAASYGASVALNPELIFVRSYGDLASNPELLSLQRYETCGC